MILPYKVRRFCTFAIGVALQRIMKNDTSIELISRCRCGQCELKISHVPRTSEPSNTFDCHCAKCRKYHGSAFTSYLKVYDDKIELQRQSTIKHYVDSCDEIGPTIERIFCSQCKCKLATRSNDTSPSTWYFNMGSIADESIRADFSKQWRKSRVSKQLHQAAAWYPAFPNYDEDDDTPQYQFTGGCSCGSARFRISKWDVPNSFEQCYCRLCRQMSGSAFVSWPWVSPQNFRWLTKEPTLMRTTDFGQRHVCDTCGVCLTIIYDDKDDNDFVYPTAGSIDSFPNVDGLLVDVMHIYCHDNAAWYDLPDNGLPRYFEEYEG
jgi:hypothetical protein